MNQYEKKIRTQVNEIMQDITEDTSLSVIRDALEFYFSKQKYARKCLVCGALINKGYVLNGGNKYFCSDSCAKKELSEDTFNQYIKEYEQEEANGGDNDDFYFTEWEDSEEFQYYADGSEV